MSTRFVVVIALAAAAVGAPGTVASTGASTPQNGVCDWGGTPDAPTGHFQLSAPVTDVPSTAPIHFVATGPATGAACSSTITFTGDLPAGSSCLVQQFEGSVQGIPGVSSFWGPGVLGTANEELYDAAGDIVGFNSPTLLNQQLLADTTSNDLCTKGGVSSGSFSAVVNLFANG